MKVPDFTKFTFPIIKKPAKNLITAENLISSPEDNAEMWGNVFKHAAEVFEALKDCKCPKCVK